MAPPPRGRHSQQHREPQADAEHRGEHGDGASQTPLSAHRPADGARHQDGQGDHTDDGPERNEPQVHDCEQTRADRGCCEQRDPGRAREPENQAERQRSRRRAGYQGLNRAAVDPATSHEVPDAEANEHQCYEQLRSSLEGFGDAHLGEHDEQPKREERDGVPSAPERRDAGALNTPGSR